MLYTIAVVLVVLWLLGNHRPHRPLKTFCQYTIAVVLIVLWLLGMVTSYTMGGFIHSLLVLAVVMVLVNLISGRRSV
jgi:uncharacterized protein DUF5670